MTGVQTCALPIFERDALQAFIASLAIPAAEKERLLAMTPASYIGKAAMLARAI